MCSQLEKGEYDYDNIRQGRAVAGRTSVERNAYLLRDEATKLNQEEPRNEGGYDGSENEGEIRGTGYKSAFRDAGRSGDYTNFLALKAKADKVKAKYAAEARRRNEQRSHGGRRPEGSVTFSLWAAKLPEQKIEEVKDAACAANLKKGEYDYASKQMGRAVAGRTSVERNARILQNEATEFIRTELERARKTEQRANVQQREGVVELSIRTALLPERKEREVRDALKGDPSLGSPKEFKNKIVTLTHWSNQEHLKKTDPKKYGIVPGEKRVLQDSFRIIEVARVLRTGNKQL